MRVPAFLFSCLVVWTASLSAEEVLVHFEKHIRPTLVSQCLKCHGPKKQEGGLRLDSRGAILKGGESGPALVPGKPEQSLLLEALRYEGLEMPPEKKLDPRIIQHFAVWIAAGAEWPKNQAVLRPAETKITDQDRQWWAFRPLVRPPLPTYENSSHPIDRFVFSRLQKEKMRPAPTAEKSVLVRRLYFDLLGVPPTPEQIDAFLQDDSPKAWENLIDQLLDDPRYGEHWARYWLDLVRYCESDGWNQDAYRPRIWRYRDYVVDAFNQDKPYPEFVLQQLAGDEIPGDHPDNLTAAGFLRLGIYEYNQRDARGHWNDIMNETTDVVGDVFLGMSMACARCHDHKFDPLLQKDYFHLRAFFEPIHWRDDLVAATDQQKQEHAQALAVWEEKTQGVRGRIDALLKPYHDKKWKSTVDKFPLEIQACFHKPIEARNSWENQMAYLVSRQFNEEGGGPLKSMKKEDKEAYEKLKKELASFDKFKPKPLPQVMTVTDFSGRPAATVIPDDPQQTAIAPGFPTVFGGEPPCGEPSEEDAPRSTSGRRTALARWIGDADNPLTTRVIVNRIWQEHFGQGVVATPNDFGHNGQRPSHPELLDWLTVEFIENGWSFKQLHRRILTSAVWRQAAQHPQAEANQQLDPQERLLWRARVRRLKAESIRDAMLSISGELQTQIGGPSVDEKTPRRALYLKSYRNKTETFLHTFDASAGLKSVALRNTTTTPTQSLLMMNGDYSLGRAKKFAQRLQAQSFADTEARLRYAFRLAWGRVPNQRELAAAQAFISPRQKGSEERFVDFCHVLFNSNEFLYVD